MQNSKPKFKTKNFFLRVYQIVKRIPRGKVATYGQIAKILKTKDARKVGWALHANKNPKVPCHRVVNREGSLAENFGFGGWREQRKRLEREGVEVMGRKVELEKYLWDRFA